MTTLTKRCCTCLKYLEVSCFGKKKSTLDGFYPVCKNCRAKWANLNKDKITAYKLSRKNLVKQQYESSKKCFIYAITGPKNKAYIGQTSVGLPRVLGNFKSLNKSSHHNPLLQKDFDDFKELFEYKILEFCDKDLLDEKEAYWILSHEGLVYNIQLPGNTKDNSHYSNRKYIPYSKSVCSEGKIGPNFGDMKTYENI